MRSEKEIQQRLDALWVRNAQVMKLSGGMGDFLPNIALFTANTLAISELQWVLGMTEIRKEKDGL